MEWSTDAANARVTPQTRRQSGTTTEWWKNDFQPLVVPYLPRLAFSAPTAANSYRSAPPRSSRKHQAFPTSLKVTMSMGQWLQPAPSRRIRQRIPQDETPHNPARLTYDRANARQSRLAAVRLSLTKTATCFSSYLVADLLTPHIRARK